MVLAVLWLAQAGVDPTSSLVQFGALGILAALAIVAVRVLFKQMETTHADVLKRERERADRYEQALDALNKDVREQVMPALTRSTEAVNEAIRLVRGNR